MIRDEKCGVVVMLSNLVENREVGISTIKTRELEHETALSKSCFVA